MKRMYVVSLICLFLFTGCTSSNNSAPQTSVRPSVTSVPVATVENIASESGMGMSVGEKAVIIEDGDTFESRDGSFQMEYPEKWLIKDMTPPAGSGQYGKILQSWVVTSYVMPQAGQGGIPDNSIKIDFSLQSADKITQLDELSECEMKSLKCENLTIGTIIYRRSESVLNSGMTAIVYETVHNGRYFNAQALINQGKSKEYINRFDEVAQTFRFFK